MIKDSIRKQLAPLSLRKMTKNEKLKGSKGTYNELDIEANTIVKKYRKYSNDKENSKDKNQQKLYKLFHRFVQFIQKMLSERFTPTLSLELTTIFDNLVFSYEPLVSNCQQSQQNELKIFVYGKLQKQVQKFREQRIKVNEKIRQVNMRMAQADCSFNQKMKKQDIQYMNTIKRLKKNIEKEEKKENKENKSSYKVIKKEAEQRNSVLRGVNENDNL